MDAEYKTQFTVFCVHQDAQETGLVCEHLVGQNPENIDYFRWFTGDGHQYILVCEVCADKFKSGKVSVQFRQICWHCYEALEREGSWEGIVGQPEIPVRSSSLALTLQRVPFSLSTPLLDLQPINSRSESEWIALINEGDLVHVNLISQSMKRLAHLTSSQIDMTKPVSLYLAPDAKMAAIVNTYGQYGVVIDLSTGEATMSLGRDTYHIEHSSFSIAFFEYDGRLLLVHSTAWNRLDISDPYTGELISQRPDPPYERGEPNSEHYLDYFHAGLFVSPDYQRIVDNGWVWQPAGIITSWNLRQWVQENVWESEKGPSYQELCQREYYWDGPLCWINEHALAIWGYGKDDYWLLPAARLFDVRTGKELSWFAGPEKGLFTFDGYLFASSKEHGFSAWDVETGERVGAFPDFCPTHYHRGAKQFLALDGQNGTALVGTLTDETG